MIDVEEFDKLYITSTNTDKVKVFDDHFFTVGDALFAYQFSDKVLDYIKGKNGVKGIHIIPLMDRSIDPYSDQFETLLVDLIKYIIFFDQTCVDNMIIITTDPEYLRISKEAIANNSRMISSTCKRFPIEEDALFAQDLSGFNSVLSASSNESWWVEPSVTIETDETYVFEPRHPDDPPSGSGTSGTGGAVEVFDEHGNKRYKYEVKIHKWDLNIKKMYSKSAGSLYSSVVIGNDMISAYYYEKGDLIPEESAGSGE